MTDLATTIANDNADLTETGKPKNSLFAALRAQGQRSQQIRDSVKQIAEQYEAANRLFQHYERVKDLIPTYRLNIVPAREEEQVEQVAESAAEQLCALVGALANAVDRTVSEISRRTNVYEIADQEQLVKLRQGALPDDEMRSIKEWLLLQ